MVGNIICPVQFGSGGFNPDDYFDPTTHIATEANFIKLLEDGIYDSSLIGYKVQLYNTVGDNYNNGLWVVADVNHDSANTGQANCYDLISEETFCYGQFSSSDYNWSSSNAKSILYSFGSGFSSEFKAHMLNIKYKSQNYWYTNDKIILPSYTEVFGVTSGIDEEGVIYPIFTDNTSRIKNNHYSGNLPVSGVVEWATRSRYAGDSRFICYVMTTGAYSTGRYTKSYYYPALIRVQ